MLIIGQHDKMLRDLRKSRGNRQFFIPPPDHNSCRCNNHL